MSGKAGKYGRIHPLLPQRHRLKFRLVHGKRLDAAQVAGRLHQHVVAGVDEDLGHQIQPLLRPVGDENLVGVNGHAGALGVALGDKGAQRFVAEGGGVLQGEFALLGQNAVGRRPQRLDGEVVGVGQPPGKGNDRRVLGDFEDFANK
jgi:hypothetical protein